MARPQPQSTTASLSPLESRLVQLGGTLTALFPVDVDSWPHVISPDALSGPSIAMGKRHIYRPASVRDSTSHGRVR